MNCGSIVEYYFSALGRHEHGSVMYTDPAEAPEILFSTQAAYTGDLNDDCMVDLSDLGILLAAWDSQPGDSHWDPRADINDDDHVDYSDLGILLANWGAGL